jgi:FixJ family two-component response regulator
VKITVYIVDSDPVEQQRIAAALGPEAGAVVPFGSAEAFLASMPLRAPALLIAAAVLPGMGIVQLLGELTRLKIELPVIAVGAGVDLQAAVDIMRAGAVDFIERPFSSRKLRNAVRRLAKGED